MRVQRAAETGLLALAVTAAAVLATAGTEPGKAAPAGRADRAHPAPARETALRGAAAPRRDSRVNPGGPELGTCGNPASVLGDPAAGCEDQLPGAGAGLAPGTAPAGGQRRAAARSASGGGPAAAPGASAGGLLTAGQVAALVRALTHGVPRHAGAAVPPRIPAGPGGTSGTGSQPGVPSALPVSAGLADIPALPGAAGLAWLPVLPSIAAVPPVKGLPAAGTVPVKGLPAAGRVPERPAVTAGTGPVTGAGAEQPAARPGSAAAPGAQHLPGSGALPGPPGPSGPDGLPLLGSPPAGPRGGAGETLPTRLRAEPMAGLAPVSLYSLAFGALVAGAAALMAAGRRVRRRRGAKPPQEPAAPGGWPVSR